MMIKKRSEKKIQITKAVTNIFEHDVCNSCTAVLSIPVSVNISILNIIITVILYIHIYLPWYYTNIPTLYI